MKQLLVAALALLAVLPSQAADTLISSFNWYNIDAYCTFQRAGESFDYEDPATWNFVFFTQHSGDGPSETGYMSIDFHLRELESLEVVQGKDGQTRHYRTYGTEPYDVTLTVSIADRGEEDSSYKGYLTVDGPGGSETIAIRGNCGV